MITETSSDSSGSIENLSADEVSEDPVVNTGPQRSQERVLEATPNKDFDQEMHDTLFEAGYSLEEIKQVLASRSLDDGSSDSFDRDETLDNDSELLREIPCQVIQALAPPSSKFFLLWNPERYMKMGGKSQILALGSKWNPFFSGIQNIECYVGGGVSRPQKRVRF